MNLYAYSVSIDGTCGVNVLYNISPNKRIYPEYQLLQKSESGGAGWILVGFINTVECREAYEQLKKLYPVVYQSPVRENLNSANDFFFCIFDAAGLEKPVETKWELS